MWPFRRRPRVERLIEQRDLAGLIRLLTDRDAEQRAAAARALAAFDPLAAAQPLIAALDDPESVVRHAAAAALAELDDDRVVAAIVERLDDRPADAARLLPILGRMATHPAARVAIERRLSAPDPEQRLAAVLALARRGDQAVVAPLIPMLTDPHPAVAEAAQAALLVVGAERVLPALVALLTNGRVEQRQVVAPVLGALSDVRALTPLVERLGDAEPAVRRAALAAIEKMPEPGRQIAVQAATGLDAVARERAAQRLRQIAAVAPLAATLRAIDHPGLRAAAARALGRLDDGGVVPALAAALTDPEGGVRQEAAWMLGVSGRPAALAPLTAALKATNDPSLRATAARALARLGLAEAATALRAASDDPEPSVATAVRQALARLEGAGVLEEAPSGLMQVVVWMLAAAEGDRIDLATAVIQARFGQPLDEIVDQQIVVMAPGQSLPSVAEAERILRQRFMTPPPGAAWQIESGLDSGSGPVLLALLAQAGA